MSTTKTQKWLQEATGAPRTKEETQWFLAMEATKYSSELGWKDRAEELQEAMKTPPTYEMLEEQYFAQRDELAEDGFSLEEEKTEIRRFYGLED